LQRPRPSLPQRRQRHGAQPPAGRVRDGRRARDDARRHARPRRRERVTHLALRRGRVVSVDRPGPAAEVTVDVGGEPRPAISYGRLTGEAEAGDEVLVNVAARDLGLGSGGVDIVHANLTRGGALPGELSRTVRELRDRGLLADHVTAGPAFGGEHEAITTAGALHAGFTALGWDAAIAGPGPGILGSATELGHGGLAALDTAHAALALG